MQVAVGRGQRDATVPGQGPKISALDEPAQHQHRLDPGRGGPLAGADVVGLAMGGQPAADGAGGGNGNVERGTIGHRCGASLGSSGILVETDPAFRPCVHLPKTRPNPQHPNDPHPTTPNPDEKGSLIFSQIMNGIHAKVARS